MASNPPPPQAGDAPRTAALTVEQQRALTQVVDSALSNTWWAHTDHRYGRVDSQYMQRAIAQGVPEQTINEAVSAALQRKKQERVKAEQQEAIKVVVDSALENAKNGKVGMVNSSAVQRAIAKGVPKQAIGGALSDVLEKEKQRQQDDALKAVVNSAIYSHHTWCFDHTDPRFGQVNLEKMQHAIAMGVAEQKILDAVAEAVEREKQTQLKQEKRLALEKEQREKELLHVREVAALFDNPSEDNLLSSHFQPSSLVKVDPMMAVNALVIARKISYTTYSDSASECKQFLSKYQSHLIQSLLEAQPHELSQGNQGEIKSSLQYFMEQLVAKLKDLDKPGVEEYEHFGDLSDLLCPNKQLYKSTVGRPDIRDHLAHCFVNKKGLERFASYLAVRPTTSGFSSFDVIHEVLFACKRTAELKYRLEDKVKTETKRIWKAVMMHINALSLHQTRQASNIITKICNVVMRIEPKMKDSCLGYINGRPTQGPTLALVSPSGGSSPRNNNAQDFFSAVESAKIRVKSFTRMKVSTEQALTWAHESFTDAQSQLNAAGASLKNANSTLSLATTEYDDARSRLTAMKQQGAALMINSMTIRVTTATQAKKASTEAAKEATKHYNAAVNSYERAKKLLGNAKSGHNLACKEVEDAQSYLNDLYKKNEVIDVDAPSQHQQKKQRVN